MKKLLVVAVSVVALMGFSVIAKAADGTKIGYVDANRVINEVAEGKTAKAKLEADGKAKKQKLEIMQNDLKKMKEDLDKQRLILSADALREKEGQFQQKFMDLQKTGMDYEKQFGEAEVAAIKPISDKLMRVVQQIGQTDGYAIIVPKEVAMYAPQGTDLTDKVIESFNKSK